MTILEKIRAEIKKEMDIYQSGGVYDGFDFALDIIDKYAEKEPTIGQLFSCEEVEELRNKIWKQVEQEPCDDAVSRQAVYEILEGNWNTDFLHSEVERLPSVQPKAKTGIWEFAYRFHRKCSVCGEVVNISEDDNYCHKCGAKMEREPNDHLSQF